MMILGMLVVVYGVLNVLYVAYDGVAHDDGWSYIVLDVDCNVLLMVVGEGDQKIVQEEVDVWIVVMMGLKAQDMRKKMHDA